MTKEVVKSKYRLTSRLINFKELVVFPILTYGLGIISGRLSGSIYQRKLFVHAMSILKSWLCLFRVTDSPTSLWIWGVEF